MTEQSTPFDHTTIDNKPAFDKNQAIDTVLMAAGALFILLALIFLLVLWGEPQSSGQATAVSIDPAAKPVQDNLFGMEPLIIEKGGVTWTVKPRAQYALNARILSSKHYFDAQSALVPFDLALAWGEMADPAVDEYIRWRQSGRWYYYNWSDDSPYSGREILTQSANVHIIPATENIENLLNGVGKNDIVYLEGMLVDLSGERRGQEIILTTSLSRSDTGGGACEILYVEKVIIDGLEYE